MGYSLAINSQAVYQSLINLIRESKHVKFSRIGLECYYRTNWRQENIDMRVSFDIGWGVTDMSVRRVLYTYSWVRLAFSFGQHVKYLNFLTKCWFHDDS